MGPTFDGDNTRRSIRNVHVVAESKPHLLLTGCSRLVIVVCARNDNCHGRLQIMIKCHEGSDLQLEICKSARIADNRVCALHIATLYNKDAIFNLAAYILPV